MNKSTQWAMVGLALLGALLVTSTSSQIRIIAFALWIIADSYWVVHNWKIQQRPLAVQFFVFLILAILGVITNL